MSVLICKNIANEGPGTIEDFLKANDVPYTVLEMSGTGDIPGSSDFDTLLMMGGPMSVNEDNIYPYIKKEEILVNEFISKGKRVSGYVLERR